MSTIRKRRLDQLSEDEFTRIMNRYLMPSSPVRREELLKGRQQQLEQVRKNLLSPGRSVFIHGLRGVGKTSLAQTAANLIQSSSHDPITSACQKSSTFSLTIKSLCAKLFRQNPLATEVEKISNGGLNFGFLSGSHTKSIREGKVPEPETIDDAIELVKFCSTGHSSNPVVIIDEFDRIEDQAQITLFGDFVKQVGDQDVNTKFIFCGVGESLEDLLADHESAYRYFASISLDRLALDPCMEIIEHAANQVGVEISRNFLFRAAWLSDGFPHYTHLIGEKLLWEIFEDPEVHEIISAAHFTNAIHSSVSDVDTHLKTQYDTATKKYGDDYQYILWAASDHPDTERRSSDIWSSYLRIMKDLGEEPLPRDSFNNRMNALKRESHGSTLIGTRQGWYKFSNPMLRGYCRLKAKERDLYLDREHFLEEEKKRGISAS